MTKTTTLDSVTVGELRSLIHYDGPEADTLAEALANMAAGADAFEQHVAEQYERQRALDAWLAARTAARREAFTAALAKQPKPHGPQAHAAARLAAHEARLEFERQNPLPEGLPEALLVERPSLVERVVQKVTGKPEPGLVA
jgi:hypothetical protein